MQSARTDHTPELTCNRRTRIILPDSHAIGAQGSIYGSTFLLTAVGGDVIKRSVSVSERWNREAAPIIKPWNGAAEIQF